MTIKELIMYCFDNSINPNAQITVHFYVHNNKNDNYDYYYENLEEELLERDEESGALRIDITKLQE
jgi:hypothetical protein